MGCDDLEPLIEAIADGTLEPPADAAAHLAACGHCAARLDRARAIDALLAIREAPAPPAAFTASVMARIGRERWKTERAVDIGFNLAIAAGLLVIVLGAGGLAWSLGFLDLTIDLGAIAEAIGITEMTGRVLSQVQTFLMAAVMLTMALGLWWWAEADSSM